MSRSDIFLSPETLKEIQKRFPDETHHIRNLFEPHPFAVREDHITVFKSPWRQVEGSLREGWD